MPTLSRKTMKGELHARQEQDYNRKQFGGGRLFRDDLKGINFWQCKEGKHILDIIPYISGPKDPRGGGKETYVLEIYVHYDVGQHEGYLICNKETFGTPCPVCEEAARIAEKDPEKAKALRVKRNPRSIYNVVVYDSKEEYHKGVQVWHTSSYLLQQDLLERSKSQNRVGPSGDIKTETMIYFPDPRKEYGRSISFRATGEKESTKYVGIALEPRDYEIEDDVLEQAKTLDELIHWPTYEEVFEEFWGYPVDDGAPVGRQKETCAADDEPRRVRPEVREEKQQEEDARPRGGREIPDEKPPEEDARPRSGREIPDEKPPVEPDPPPRRSPVKEKETTTDNPCPHGYQFGTDIDSHKECNDCPVWKDCARECSRLEDLAKKGTE